MKIILDIKEVLDMIHSALCNGGLSELRYSNVELNVSKEEYAEAKAEVQKVVDAGEHESIGMKDYGNGIRICIEDVYAQILRSGKSLNFKDTEGGEDLEFSLEKAIKELSKEEAQDIVLTYKEHGDDAITATELLQHCLYGEVIFG